MVTTLIAGLAPAVPPVRLEAYRNGGTDLEMVVNYFWNIELGKALYPALQTFEVSLRNGVHAAASAHYGTPLWFDRPDVLLQVQLDHLDSARRKLREAGKVQNSE